MGDKHTTYRLLSLLARLDDRSVILAAIRTYTSRKLTSLG